MLDLGELLKDAPVETQNQIYEKLMSLDESEKEPFAEQVAALIAERKIRMNTHSEERERREARAPKVGEPAPDFEISLLDGDQKVRLSDLRGRPVGLIFGSYT
jgi:hypothetical protein